MTFQKETIMLLKVDLDCTSCYKKVKKLLCSFPQIKDQAYNEKQNIVMIKVVCCCPEKIRDKLRCKGGKSIKEIQILDPPKPDPSKQPPTKPSQPKPPTKPPPVPETEPTPRKEIIPVPSNPPPTKPPTAPKQDPVQQTNTCCSDCFEGRNTGPCYNGYRNGYPYGYGCEYGVVPPPPPPPPPFGGRGGYYYGGCPPCGYRPCYEYVVYDNSPACVIM